MSSGSDDGTGAKKRKGPNQKQKHRGDIFNTPSAQLAQFTVDNKNYREFRAALDGMAQADKEAAMEAFGELNEDLVESGFFNEDISTEDECYNLRELGNGTLNSMQEDEKESMIKTLFGIPAVAAVFAAWEKAAEDAAGK